MFEMASLLTVSKFHSILYCALTEKISKVDSYIKNFKLLIINYTLEIDNKS